MLVTLGVLIIAMAVISYAYHRHQNKAQTIGGKISTAKSFWLGYALYHYFIYPVFFYFLIADACLKNLLLCVCFWFYLRMFLQGLMMFVFQNWTPKFGIAHNILSVFLLATALLIIGLENYKSFSTEVVIVSIFLFNLILISAVDTLYADRFSQIVGEKTKGKQAIWYAAETKEFEKINSMTSRNNYLFVLLSVILIVIISCYDKF